MSGSPKVGVCVGWVILPGGGGWEGSGRHGNKLASLYIICPLIELHVSSSADELMTCAHPTTSRERERQALFERAMPEKRMRG